MPVLGWYVLIFTNPQSTTEKVTENFTSIIKVMVKKTINLQNMAYSTI